MLVEAQVTINATRAAVWAVLADIANAAQTCSGIEKIEILERPAQGLQGLKWRETRILFGKPASADKRITEVVDGEFYKTQAEDGGFVFVSTMRLSEGASGVVLSTLHDSLPQTFGARLMAIPMGLFFKGVARKALMQDLNDIKAAAERQQPQA